MPLLQRGLGLWFVAEILWIYYSIFAGVDPFPSLADAFWIAGYAPFAYHLIATYRFFGQAVRPHVIIIVSMAVALFVGHTSTLVFEAAAATQEDFTATAISVAYLVFDAVLIVPAIIVLASLRQGKLTFTPWIILASSRGSGKQRLCILPGGLDGGRGVGVGPAVQHRLHRDGRGLVMALSVLYLPRK